VHEGDAVISGDADDQAMVERGDADAGRDGGAVAGRTALVGLGRRRRIIRWALMKQTHDIASSRLTM
jgi:hypothetical protein